MRRPAALLAIVASTAFTAAQAATPPSAPVPAGAKERSESAPQARILKPAPAPESAPGSPSRGRTFEVNDVKGLLLKCNAPQLDTNPDTDLFDSCTLAPGRTLDDLMHTFIQAFHFVQNEQAKERAEWAKEREEKLEQKPAQK